MFQQNYLRALSLRQRKARSLFQRQNQITASDVQSLFGIQPRTVRARLADWADTGFLVVSNPSRKARKHRLAEKLHGLVEQ